jgi:prepilin-type N-terminal cleavage/methylation domain-containing protein
MTAKTRATRAGFTLVEMLMVIAIIAVLASLLFVGIGRVRKSALKAQAANDIQQLELSASQAGFKKDFGMYPPSHVTTSFGVMRFRVPAALDTGTGTSGTAAQQQNDRSLDVLRRMFPRWTPTLNTTTGMLDIPLAGQYLDPNQCLVYFLGGPAALNPALGQPGWDVASPTFPTGNTKKGPYFDFPAARVTIPESTTGYVSGNNLPNFVDPWGVPYAYFAASGDNYDGRLFFPFGSNFTPPPGDAAAPSTAYSGTGMRPVRMGNKWVNPGKCQIVSAGPNQRFGPGSPATQTTPTLVYQDLRPGQTAGYSEGDNRGEDDIANFNEGSALGTSSAP